MHKFDFHKWKQPLLNIDRILTLVIILLVGLARPDIIVIVAFILILPYLILTDRTILVFHYLIALIVSMMWMIVARNQYNYNQEFIAVYGVNLFPLFYWAIGLFAVYLIYSHYEHKLHEKGFFRKLALFLLIYWPALIIVETLAYHTFGIVNLATVSYSGLPVCDCLHAPQWMQVAYFLIGIIYFGICYLLGLENPHYTVNYRKA